MKEIKILLATCLLSIQVVFAQDKVLIIDQEGNVGINTETPSKTLDVNGSVNFEGKLNGINIYELNSEQSSYVLTDMAKYISTLSISHQSGCQSRGTSAMVFYDASENKFKIIGQAGSGSTNRVEVSSSAANTLNFYNDCGTTVTLTFNKSGSSDIAATVVKSRGNLAQFNILSQGF